MRTVYSFSCKKSSCDATFTTGHQDEVHSTIDLLNAGWGAVISRFFGVQYYCPRHITPSMFSAYGRVRYGELLRNQVRELPRYRVWPGWGWKKRVNVVLESDIEKVLDRAQKEPVVERLL